MLVREPQPGMHERAPVGQVIVGFAAVVVEHDALAQHSRRRASPAPGRAGTTQYDAGEHVHDVGDGQPSRLGR